MKTTVDWLRDFVSIELSAQALAEDLTMAGLEVDGVTPVGGDVEGVVVAEILERHQHPNADRLSVCRVTDGTEELEIVCGAANAAPGLKVPLARVGTVLPAGQAIDASEIRGVRSAGMLCSAQELALGDDGAGLFILDDSAKVGADLREHLKLDDTVLDIDLTPNRGDCFSVLGLAREVAARQGMDPLDEAQDCVLPGDEAIHDVELEDKGACPRFAGRVITGIRPDARSPDWMRERLRRADLRPIHPVVDVTNYVMLEFGQPLHAYRLDKLKGPIRVRFAKAGERLTLLDASELTLDDDALVIADDSGAIGLAGIMGGASTAVDATTDSIFLESAFFAPTAIQGRARRYGLHTDASTRFERGVDPSGQERAVERATSLLLEIAGGVAGPVVVAEDPDGIPHRDPIVLHDDRIASVLGVEITDDDIRRLLARLGMQIDAGEDGWRVTPPSYRFDISIEEDLIEEVGRMIGYDRIPASPGRADIHLGKAVEAEITPDRLEDFLVARGYSEIVSYGFVDAAVQARITGSNEAIALANPISQDLGVMRATLWGGLLNAARLNLSHQLPRCRLFEVGTVFAPDGDGVVESKHVAGLVTGSRQPAHWEGSSAPADFFDLKGDVEGLLSHWRNDLPLQFHIESHPALNPARSSAVYFGSTRVGWIGELHPALQAEHDFKEAVVLFELKLDSIDASLLPKFTPHSRFPSSRRDLAVVVDEQVAAAELTKHIVDVLGDSLQRYEVFDIYRGKGIDPGRKSIGIGLILQNASRTLTDDETDDMIERVMRRLEDEFQARIRS